MINNVVLVGRLTRAVDLRYTSNGTAYASFSIAIDRRYQNQNGERETDRSFHTTSFSISPIRTLSEVSSGMYSTRVAMRETGICCFT